MKGIEIRRAVAGAILTLTATHLHAGGNVIDLDDSEPHGMIVQPSARQLQANPELIIPGGIDDPQFLEAYINLEKLVQEGPLDQADAAAKRMVELAIRAKGSQSTEVADALTNLAIVQQQSQQLDAATVNYRSAIEIIESVEDRLNALLLNPLKGLATAQLESGRPDLAQATFTRAIHITHVTGGPHNSEQLELLEDLAEVHLRMSDLEAASDAQDRIYSIMVRTHDLDSLDLIPSLIRRAEWQHNVGMINDERATYRQVVRILEKNLRNNDVALADPLVRLGKTFFYADTSGKSTFLEPQLATAKTYLRRAVRVAAGSGATNWRIIADATLALGDFYMFDRNSRHAKQIYRAVWNLLSESEDDTAKLQKRDEELQRLVLLREQALPRYVSGFKRNHLVDEDDPVLQGSIAYRFAVSERGRAEDVTLIEAAPPDFGDMQASVVNEILRRIYRPTFVEAEPVATRDQILAHTFDYRQSDLDKARKAAAEAALLEDSQDD